MAPLYWNYPRSLYKRQFSTKFSQNTPHSSTHCGLVSPYGDTDIGSGTGLLPDGTKPLPEPMLTYHHTVQWHSSSISQEIPHPSITKTSLQITYLNFHSNLSGDNELILRATDGVTLSVINLIYVCCLSSLFYCMQNHGIRSIFLWERAKCPFDNMIMMTSSNGNIFRVTGLLCGEFIGFRWILHTKASDTELWCFLCFASN